MLMIALICLLVVAALYSAVGHGGASGYLAVLLLFSFSPEDVRPLVLCMNLVVTSYLLLRAQKRDWVQQRVLISMTLFSIPAAFLGGALEIDAAIYGVILGAFLGLSAMRLFLSAKTDAMVPRKPDVLWVALLGGLLGFISGFTGIGGGVLLSPILVFLGWASVKKSIPLVALFIFANSLSGLAGWFAAGRDFVIVDPAFFYACLALALAGAWAGSYWSRRLAKVQSLRYVLAFVLSLAAIKMVWLAV